jgi:hypothetical protein
VNYDDNNDSNNNNRTLTMTIIILKCAGNELKVLSPVVTPSLCENIHFSPWHKHINRILFYGLNTNLKKVMSFTVPELYFSQSVHLLTL